MSSQTIQETQPNIQEPQTANEYLQRAWLHLAKRESAEAEMDFKQVLMLNNQIADAYYGLGLTNLEQGHQDSAMNAFRQALDLINSRLIKEEPQRGTVLRNLTISQIRMLENGG